jgi:hypothetical protein
VLGFWLAARSPLVDRNLTRLVRWALRRWTRLDVRDYVSGYRPLGGAGASHVRNDVVVMAGLRLVRR